ncbi:DUF2637 domain-containing protein [Streptomyces carpaticus]|uniref:DUF2637 domain-containing protein n=1 Tax=Streptomyces carpaticus TaxID=285558 RepID=UPI0031F86A88
MKRLRNPQVALAAASAVVIIALTAVAFWLSYAHLAAVAGAHGLGDAPDRQWAWPATLDLFIVAGELLMLRAALARRIDWWAIGLTVIGSGGSIALNVAGVGTKAEVLDYVVAAVPPTAALLAFGALMRQIHQMLAPKAEEGTAAPVPPVPPVVPVPVPPVPVQEPTTVEAIPEHRAVTPQPPAADPAPAPVVFPLSLDRLAPLAPRVPSMTGTNGAPRPPRFPWEQESAARPESTPVPRRESPVPAEPTPVPPVPATGTGAADIVSEDTANTRFQKHVAQAREWLATEPQLTGTAIGTRLGTSDGYGRRVRRAALRETS